MAGCPVFLYIARRSDLAKASRRRISTSPCSSGASVVFMPLPPPPAAALTEPGNQSLSGHGLRRLR